MIGIISNIKYLKVKNYIIFIILSFIFIVLYNPILVLKISFVDKTIKELGFQLKYINVKNNINIEKKEIISKIKFFNCQNLFCLDLKTTKNILEHNNWIKSVSLKLQLPSTLIVSIKEEKPAFLLKNKEEVSLLNNNGKFIEKLNYISENYKNLIVLSGEEAERNINSLLNILSVNTIIAKDIKGAFYVSKRRWTLKHSSNITIDLPAINPGEAFYKIGELQKKYGFLSKKIKKVDLRVSNRMIIELKERKDLLEESKI